MTGSESIGSVHFKPTLTFMHLANAFIQSIQAVLFFFFVSVFPGNWTHNLCTANAMLYHWATGTLDHRNTWTLYASDWDCSALQTKPDILVQLSCIKVTVFVKVLLNQILVDLCLRKTHKYKCLGQMIKFSHLLCLLYLRDAQTRSWRARVLQSLAPTLIKHTRSS